jgi:hypothetical protein
LLQDKLGISNLGSYYWYSKTTDTARIGSCYWYSETIDIARVGCSCWIGDSGYELGDSNSGIRVCKGILADLFGINYISLSSSAFLSRLFSV